MRKCRFRTTSAVEGAGSIRRAVHHERGCPQAALFAAWTLRLPALIEFVLLMMMVVVAVVLVVTMLVMVVVIAHRAPTAVSRLALDYERLLIAGRDVRLT